jgi:hypothetical protein
VLCLFTVHCSLQSCACANHQTAYICMLYSCCSQALAEDSKVDDDVKSKIVAGMTDRILVASIGQQIAAALEQVGTH